MATTKTKRKPHTWAGPSKSKGTATAEPIREGQPSKPRDTVVNRQQLNVLLHISGDTLTRLDANLTKLLKHHFYAPKPVIPEEQFEEARRLAVSKGEKEANLYLKECRAKLDNPTKYKPSRHSFIYALINIGLDAYEQDSERLTKLILFGEKPAQAS